MWGKEIMENENLHKEIDLIQECINCIAKNSFSCKGWNLTLIAGVFTLVSEDVNRWYLGIVVLCVDLCFWWLDSFYLLQEQKYRDKYEWVIKERLKGNKEFLYDLNPNNNDMNFNLSKKRSWIKAAVSRTICPMYGGIVVLTIVFMIVKLVGGM